MSADMIPCDRQRHCGQIDSPEDGQRRKTNRRRRAEAYQWFLGMGIASVLRPAFDAQGGDPRSQGRRLQPQQPRCTARS
jgi:hypothetical protein